MKIRKSGIIGIMIVVVVGVSVSLLMREKEELDLQEERGVLPVASSLVKVVGQTVVPRPQILFVGPRENIPEDAPTAYGFWSFAIPVTNVLSRSGQPLIGEFEWLRENGWQSVIDLRTDGERDEVGDDAKISGFNELGFTYKYMPIIDGHPPTEEQAMEFLQFVTNPVNQPVHIHCRGGIGRTGTLVALYRYAIQSWPMEQAIEESRAFQGGVSTLQEPWLLEWAQTHAPGEYGASK